MASTDKTELRQTFQRRRLAIEPAVRQRDSAIIRQRITRLVEWEDAGTLLCYVSMDAEVDTRKLIEEALGRRKRVIVPIVEKDGTLPMLSELRSLNELEPGPIRGLHQQSPRFRRPAEPREVEVALVPGLAFDREGGRLGFGGGYFDRLLPGLTQAVRVGLAFSLQIHDHPLPVGPHDVRMHKIVTESEIIIPRCLIAQDPYNDSH